MTNIVSIQDRRTEEAAKQIARNVDPQAGGFFLAKLEEAARLGIQYAKQAPHIPASGDR